MTEKDKMRDLFTDLGIEFELWNNPAVSGVDKVAEQQFIDAGVSRGTFPLLRSGIALSGTTFYFDGSGNYVGRLFDTDTSKELWEWEPRV